MHYKEFTYFSFSTVSNYSSGWKDIFFSVITNASNNRNGKVFPISGWYCTAEREIMHCLPRGSWVCGTARICQAANEAPLWGLGLCRTASLAAAGQPLLWGKRDGTVPPDSYLCALLLKERLTRGFPDFLKTTVGGGMTIPSCNV